MVRVRSLIFILLITINGHLFAQGVAVQQIKDKLYTRLSFLIAKDQLVVEKKGSSVFLKTLNRQIFNELKQKLAEMKLDGTYFKQVVVNEIDHENNVVSIELKLANDFVEMFHFYKGGEYCMDFWLDEDAINMQKAAVARPAIVQKEAPVKKTEEIKVKAPVAQVSTKKEEKKKEITTNKQKDSNFRDFRYGASFIWDYAPLAPTLKQVINLESKTPEYFYPIPNRNYEKSEQEAHLQTSINLFRKKKWGLMYKSIKLYEQKYGEMADVDINEYLKANALLRSNFSKGEKAPIKAAINMLENVVKRTQIYDLKKGIMKYLINYYIGNNENIEALKLAKRFYVESKEQFDIEESQYAAETILFNLSNLGQLEVLQELLKEKTIQKLLPPQVMLAYEIYTLLKTDRPEEVLRLYESNKKNLVAPIHPVILFNVAEAYFRTAKFEKAINLLDEFVTQYSHYTYAGHARVRIGLAYEILERDPQKTLTLYKNAINRSLDEEVNYEARIRYVGLRSVRKRNIGMDDREVRVFLERKGKEAERGLSLNLRNLLWLVRLRTYIADAKFTEALSYLNAIPVNTMKPSEMRVFESDGAEIVYGILLENYKQANYSNVIQLWEVYKDRYVDKVASDPFMNFLVGRSFLRLGLYDGFDRLVKTFAKIQNAPLRSFPLWNERVVSATSADMVLELQIVRNIELKNWEAASSLVADLEQDRKDNPKLKYYKGMIAYYQDDYKKTVSFLEQFLGQEEVSLYDSREVAEMLGAYSNALYSLGNIERFEKVAEAILNDTSEQAEKNSFMIAVRERISYLLIEIVAGRAKTSEEARVLESKIEAFKKAYKTSLYQGRVNYLLALALIANNRLDEGEGILKELINGSEIPDYIKELARSELSLLRIKEKTL